MAGTKSYSLLLRLAAAQSLIYGSGKPETPVGLHLRQRGPSRDVCIRQVQNCLIGLLESPEVGLVGDDHGRGCLDMGSASLPMCFALCGWVLSTAAHHLGLAVQPLLAPSCVSHFSFPSFRAFLSVAP